MQISQFARAAGLSVDTVRFYVKRGLLAPQISGKGGSNPYQQFAAADLETAQMIKMAQSLGYTLREIADFQVQLADDGHLGAVAIGFLRERLADLDEKAAQIAAVSGFFRAKLDWLQAGSNGVAPAMADHLGLGAPALARRPQLSPTTSVGSAPNQR